MKEKIRFGSPWIAAMVFIMLVAPLIAVSAQGETVSQVTFYVQ